MIAQNVFFGIIAAAMVISALGVVTTKNVVHAALYLVVVLASVAAIYILLFAEFVATEFGRDATLAHHQDPVR